MAKIPSVASLAYLGSGKKKKSRLSDISAFRDEEKDDTDIDINRRRRERAQQRTGRRERFAKLDLDVNDERRDLGLRRNRGRLNRRSKLLEDI